MQYRFEESFSTDYPFQHQIIDDSICWNVELINHPLVDLTPINSVPKDLYDYQVVYRSEVLKWIEANFKIYCEPLWITDMASLERFSLHERGYVRFAFTTMDQAMRFKLKYQNR